MLIPLVSVFVYLLLAYLAIELIRGVKTVSETSSKSLNFNEILPLLARCSPSQKV